MRSHMFKNDSNDASNARNHPRNNFFFAFKKDKEMKSRMINLKFLFSLIIHLLMFAFFLICVGFIPDFALTGIDMIKVSLFSILYFLFIWHDIYSRSYHHYLKNAFHLIFRDLLICSLLFISFEYFFFLFLADTHTRRELILYSIITVEYFILHSLLYFWVFHLAELGFFNKKVLLVGSYDERLPVEKLIQNVNDSKTMLGQLVNSEGNWYFHRNSSKKPELIRSSLSDFLFSINANEIIMCMDETITSSALTECATWCLDNSIGYYLIPDIRKLPLTYPWQNKFGSLPIIERYCPNRDSLVMISFKRMFDLAISSIALFALSPIFILLSFLIWIEDGGSVFYISDRVGIHGRMIRFIKFRSMVLNAESMKKDLLHLNERPDGPLFKISNDPRVTRIGRIMRNTSLDEIPQFINVLKGDMSLIGPRPHLPSEVKEYSDIDHLRIECMPGISCLPQIFGRDSIGFREWVDLDLKYRKNWSFLYDLQILKQTIKVVFHPIFNVSKR